LGNVRGVSLAERHGRELKREGMEMNEHKRAVGFAGTPRAERNVEDVEDGIEEDLEAATTASISEGSGGEEEDEEDDELEDEDAAEAEREGGEAQEESGDSARVPTPAKKRRRKVGDPARHTMYNVPARRAKFVPLTLRWENLFYSIRVREGKNPLRKKHKKTLLKDLHGELRPGEVTAIMGPSGTAPPLLATYEPVAEKRYGSS
jgi:ABC-type multidrug transport system fused ATPase/permease subunit